MIAQPGRTQALLHLILLSRQEAGEFVTYCDRIKGNSLLVQSVFIIYLETMYSSIMLGDERYSEWVFN